MERTQKMLEVATMIRFAKTKRWWFNLQDFKGRVEFANLIKVADAKKQDSMIDDLPDDVIVDILSRIHRREAVRTSVLSRRWRYLSSFCSSPGTLKLDYRDLFSSVHRNIPWSEDRASFSSRSENLRDKFTDWVNRVLELHEDLSLDCLIIRSTRVRSTHIWIDFAMQKEIKILELDFSMPGRYHSIYCFPNLSTLKSYSREHAYNKFGFVSLRSLRLVGVDIKDEVVHYFLASCPYLEQLCIGSSEGTKNLKVLDPLPNLKVFGISDCKNIKSIEISVADLVSFTYVGDMNILVSSFKEIPNITELTISGELARSFIYEPKKHSSYSVQLVKLGLSIPMKVGSQPSSQRSYYRTIHRDGGSQSSDPYLGIHRTELPRLKSLVHFELSVVLPVGKSIQFFAKFIYASPLLKELRIKISYMVTNPQDNKSLPFPEEFPSALERPHRNLKVVSMSGYVGCSSDDKFILGLLNNAQSVETVAIDTESGYYHQKPWDCATKCPKERRGPCMFCTKRDTGARTRVEAKRRANQLKLTFPPKTKAVLIVT